MEIEPIIEITVKCDNCDAELQAEFDAWNCNTLTVAHCTRCTITCTDCGEKLTATWDGGDLEVEPCARCLDAAQEEAREESKAEKE